MLLNRGNIVCTIYGTCTTKKKSENNAVLNG